MLAVVAVVVLVGPHLLHTTPSRATGAHATVESLPAGVCPLSTEGWLRLADPRTSVLSANDVA
jgi:hypothetical protein